MRILLSLPMCVAGALAVLLAACGPSKPPPEFPDADKRDPSEITDTEPSGEPEPGGEASAQPSKKPAADSVPDDYSMTMGNCRELGIQYAALIRSESRAQLSPKLSDAQRTAADKNINEVATKRGNEVTENCAGTVGQIVDPKALKCAMSAKATKDFDACLNAQQPPK